MCGEGCERVATTKIAQVLQKQQAANPATMRSGAGKQQPGSPGSTLAQMQRGVGNQAVLRGLRNESEESPPVTSKHVFTFQTFIPDHYVPGLSVTDPVELGLGYGDDRDFGKPGDHYRTFQQIVVETDERLNPSGVEGEPVGRTGLSESPIPGMTGHASAEPLHMAAKRTGAHSVNVSFDASITNGALVGGLLPAIDYSGSVAMIASGGKLHYGLYVSHDAFPAYEAFIDDKPIYRWSYPAGSTVADLVGSGTAIKGLRKTNDDPGGSIARENVPFGGGKSGGGGSGGTY